MSVSAVTLTRLSYGVYSIRCGGFAFLSGGEAAIHHLHTCFTYTQEHYVELSLNNETPLFLAEIIMIIIIMMILILIRLTCELETALPSHLRTYLTQPWTSLASLSNALAWLILFISGMNS